MSAASDSVVVYEQPLSERIRAFLRLEFLFARAHYMLLSSDVWASRGALEAINDVMSVVSRADLKKELINELERHASTLKALARNPAVDQETLSSTLDRVDDMLTSLRRLETAPGLELREHELLSAVRQRSSIPAGTCDFDLPNYHFWLRCTPEQRHADLTRWLSTFSYLQDATALCLELVRQSALASTEVDLSPVEQGQAITIMWRGKPVFIRNRTQKEIDEARAVKLADLPDPQTDAQRRDLVFPR